MTEDFPPPAAAERSKSMLAALPTLTERAHIIAPPSTGERALDFAQARLSGAFRV